MKEKRSQEGQQMNQGLNEGNPNTERTPVSDERIRTGIIGGVQQSNTRDEEEGEVPDKTNHMDNKDTGSR